MPPTEPTFSPWLLYALGSAFFAALTTILGKIGVSEINSNLATLIRTLVILVLTIGIVSISHAWEPFEKLSRTGFIMIIFSGIATGLSWLCYYRALQLAPASRVAPIDKLSVVLVIVMAILFLREPITWKIAVGGILITAGAVVLAL